MISISNKKYNDMLYDSKPVKFRDFISNKYNIVHKQLYENALAKYIKEWVEVKRCLSRNEELRQSFENRVDIDEEIYLKDKEEYYNNLKYIKDNYSDKSYIEGKHIFDVNSYADFKDNSSIIEIPNDEYWKPSKCIIITKYISQISPILKWEVDLTKYWNRYQEKKEKELENIKISQENILDSEIIELNYVTGKAKLYSETLDREYELDFDYLNGDTNKVSENLILS